MAWRPLSLSASAGAHLPALLISAAFSSTSYTIHLTDLSHIWSESLDQCAIISRSTEENTSIDPSNGDQFEIFFEKLELGLAGTKDTALALTLNTDGDQPDIVLNVTVPLPGGLAPLEWPIHFSAGPSSLLTSQLTLPLVKAQHDRVRELTGLQEVLKEKDHIILKLLDKLEASGIDLGQVFPQVVVKAGHNIDRKKAEQKVRGLGSFDMERWRNEMEVNEMQDTAQLIGEVFTAFGGPYLKMMGDQVLDVTENWWDSIRGITIRLDSGKIASNGLVKAKARPPPKPELKTEESIDDDAFQVQATPPRLESLQTKLACKPMSVDSTDDEDDLDMPSQNLKIPDSFPKSPSPPSSPPARPVKRLGRLGGRKVDANRKPPLDRKDTGEDLSSTPNNNSADATGQEIQPVNKPERALLGKIGGKKHIPAPVSIIEEESKLNGPVSESSKPVRGRLGRIGGKRKEVTPVSVSEPDYKEAIQSPTEASPSAKTNLGAIGHGRLSTSSRAEDGAGQKFEELGNTRGRAQIKPEREETPSARETSLERADRKREQLRRDLEQKAKAPAKKKRKF